MELERRGRVKRSHDRGSWEQEDFDACDRQAVPEVAVTSVPARRTGSMPRGSPQTLITASPEHPVLVVQVAPLGKVPSKFHQIAKNEPKHTKATNS